MKENNEFVVFIGVVLFTTWTCMLFCYGYSEGKSSVYEKLLRPYFEEVKK